MNSGTDKVAANRSFQRYKLDIRAKVIVGPAGRTEVIHARTTHIAVGGIGLTLTREMKTGTVATVEFKLPNCEAFKMRAEMRYRNGFRCGFKFLEITHEQRSLIRTFCNDLPVKQL